MNILVLCTGNSARSILLESILTHSGAGRITAFSAGSQPTGKVNPGALTLLNREGHDTSQFHSKSWDIFGAKDAPKMDIVITVCGSAANETCPIWPGTPLRAHWGVEDPADATGEAIAPAFQKAYDILAQRATHFLSAPVEALETDALKTLLDESGKIE